MRGGVLHIKPAHTRHRLEGIGDAQHGFGGAERHFPPGQAVEVDNLGPHWVRNEGDTDRIHLIFEYYDADQPDPDWLAPFLRGGAAR